MWQNLYTKDQMLNVMAGWGTNLDLPGKNKVVIVNFPPTAQFKLARIEKSTVKGTYGTPMYAVKMLNDSDLEGEKILSGCWLAPAINPKAIRVAQGATA